MWTQLDNLVDLLPNIPRKNKNNSLPNQLDFRSPFDDRFEVYTLSRCDEVLYKLNLLLEEGGRERWASYACLISNLGGVIIKKGWKSIYKVIYQNLDLSKTALKIEN